MTVGNYSPRSISNYIREMRFIFQHYPDVEPAEISAEQIEQYICYIKETYNSGYEKCHMVAASVSFYFKNVLKQPYALPSKLYPRQRLRLPNVMTPDEVWLLLSKTGSIKQKALVELFYSTGVRLDECRRIKIADIDSHLMRIKVVQGKGRKDRYTLLSSRALNTLREYYRKHRPSVYLFEGQTIGKTMHCRSIQHSVEQAMKRAGIRHKGYSAHTLRHSFATHLIDTGTDINTIKELLGHSNIRTTIIYLHMQTHRCSRIVNPLDYLVNQHSRDMTHGSKND